jgi:endonuclease YncB( thermonuclease family)
MGKVARLGAARRSNGSKRRSGGGLRRFIPPIEGFIALALVGGFALWQQPGSLPGIDALPLFQQSAPSVLQPGSAAPASRQQSPQVVRLPQRGPAIEQAPARGVAMPRDEPQAMRVPRPEASVGGAVHVRFTICGPGARRDCVVDGDTIWLAGQKIRIADINTPELSQPQCARERQLAIRARDRLHVLLNQGPVQLQRIDRDEDRYGRKLRTIHRNGTSLGDTLVSEGLAHRWNGQRQSWCG